MIPYGQQDISAEDIEAVVDVLRSPHLTQGPAVPDFEKCVADHCGALHSVAVNSATSALHIACLALDVGPGDTVWTSPVTFVASANCALYCGARIDFVDIDPRTYNMSPERLAERLARAEADGGLPKVVIPVHLCGQPCDMAAIHALSQQYGFRIIEDASHAIGGEYRGESIGNCRFSDITVFSFHPVKIITTAEGGMAMTNNTRLARRMQMLRSHGITREEAEMTRPSDGPWYYQQIDLGFNYRMTDIQAALGKSQMRRLGEFVANRHQLANRYNQMLADLPVVTPWQHGEGYSAFHLYVVQFKLSELDKSRRQVFESVRAAGIGVNLHYIPVHLQPYYEKQGFKLGDFPESERYYQNSISLPLFPSLSDVQQGEVVDALREALVSNNN
jgi:UDP-4-amino-4,6-dideoxy-N-acetyl-beta-L-altrosamine transaminase